MYSWLLLLGYECGGIWIYLNIVASIINYYYSFILLFYQNDSTFQRSVRDSRMWMLKEIGQSIKDGAMALVFW